MNDSDPRIEVLPPYVVEKIAAGEVIERPASVLKEFLENSVDAGATRINVVVEDSGFSLIQVSDNGCGMARDNLQKSVLLHATSKIRTANDLYAVATMGFRGEALASIGSVSRTTVASSASTDGLGFMLSCEGGVVRPPSPVSHARGTTVRCQDLFFNVPARKKFMKTRKSERVALVKMLEQLVVPFPSIHFTAVFDGKSLFDMPVADSPIGRISQVAGVDFARSLLKAQGSAKGMEATIYFPLSGEDTTRPRYQNLYVNLRRVENDSVLYAIRQAFAQLIRRDARPSFFCFIDVDPAAIDVNVHPTKQKVKFENERELFSFVFGMVSRVLKPSPEKGFGPVRHDRSTAEGSSVMEPASTYAGSSGGEQPGKEPARFSTGEKGDRSVGQTILSFPARGPQNQPSPESAGGDGAKLTDGDEAPSWNLISCYQIHQMFVLAPIKNGILLIDQHAAHERILYEQALDDLTGGRSASQQLLFPLVLRLAATEKAVAVSSTEYFEAFGFDIKDFGGSDVSVSATPSFMKNADIEHSVRDMLTYLLDEKSVEHFPEPHQRFAAAFACGAAIKSGQRLSEEEMNALLNSLFSSKNPYTCPHGRPTVVRISLDELSRRFLR